MAPKKQIKRTTNLADLIQEAGLVGSRGKQDKKRAMMRPQSAPGRRRESKDENIPFWIERGQRLSQSTSTSGLLIHTKVNLAKLSFHV